VTLNISGIAITGLKTFSSSVSRPRQRCPENAPEYSTRKFAAGSTPRVFVISVCAANGDLLLDVAILLAFRDQGPITKILQAISVATLRGPWQREAREPWAIIGNTL
jgi:hypothetical protein